MSEKYDALLFVSFGGPEGPDDVMPFLENVLRGKNVPHARMLEVAEHYQHFGGVSPINAQCRALIAAIEQELAQHGPHLPIYWGNRNWHPLLADTMQRMADDGVTRALAFFTSAFSSYSGCRQYRENVTQAQQTVGARAPIVEKLRVFYNHPGFLEPMIRNVRQCLEQVPHEHHSTTQLVFTAHSIPMAMSENCRYVEQLQEACRLVAEAFPEQTGRLVYQSRSGPPTQPWLEPDICDYLVELDEQTDVTHALVIPIGFISDHLEVLFDLDTEAQQLCQSRRLKMIRVPTVGTDPRFVQMIRELIVERVEGGPALALGKYGPSHDVCPEDCCLSGFARR